MASPPPDPSAGRIPVLKYPTPDIRDVVFFIHVNSELAEYDEPSYGTPYEGVSDSKDKFCHHKLVLVTRADDSGWVKWYYAADREEQHKYNFEYADPTASSGEYQNYTRTYFIRRDDIVLPDPDHDILDSQEQVTDSILSIQGEGKLNVGDADPDGPPNQCFGGFVFTGNRVLRVPDAELDSCYVLLVRRFENLCEKTGSRINSNTGELEQFSDRILPVGHPDLVGSAADTATGVGSFVTPINCNFSRLESRVVRPFTDREYDTTINYNWPAVLHSITMKTWVLRGGSDRFYPFVRFLRSRYNGPTKATITESWSMEPPECLPIRAMLPLTIHFTSPFFNLNTGACLHPHVFVQADTGNNDPTWSVNAGSREDFLATNYVDWPETLLISSRVIPNQNGYVLQNTVVYRPDIPDEI